MPRHLPIPGQTVAAREASICRLLVSKRAVVTVTKETPVTSRRAVVAKVPKSGPAVPKDTLKTVPIVSYQELPRQLMVVMTPQGCPLMLSVTVVPPDRMGRRNGKVLTGRFKTLKTY